jgi:arylsulfatase A-like enzyme
MKIQRYLSETDVNTENAISGEAADPISLARGFWPADTIRLTLWLCLASGLLEGAYRLYQIFLRERAVGISPHIIWMAPLANLVWAFLPLLVLALLGRLRRGKNQRWPVTMVVTIAVLGLILLNQGTHKGAAVVLAMGVAWQLAPRLMRSVRFNRLVRQTIPALVMLIVLGWGALAFMRWNHERRMVAELPDAPGRRPNVLLLVWDTVRGFSMSVYGYDRPTTPFIERFAAEGARFDLAMSPAPWTLPSHGSMFTGQRPAVLSARLNVPLDGKYPVIAEAFTRAGYVTGGFAANMSYVSREHGLARGFSHYRDFRLSPSGILGSSRIGAVLLQFDAVRNLLGYFELPGRKSAGVLNQEFLGWLDAKDDRPFFAFLNYFDSHQPYLAPGSYREGFSLDVSSSFNPRWVDAEFRDMSAEEIDWSRSEYDATIAYLDAELANLIGQLARRGILDNTIVMITSDHGEHFGDHRRVSHGNSLYRQLLQVPLVIRYPARIPKGTTVGHPVSLTELPQTMFDLAGVKDTQVFPGRSLSRFWNPGFEPDSTEVVLSEMPTANGERAFSLAANGYHYIRWFGRPPQLFHLKDNPEETKDLAAAPEAAEVLRMFAALETRYTELPDDQGRP